MSFADGTTSTGYDVALATSLIQDGLESSGTSIGQSGSLLDNQLGSISVSRFDGLFARSEQIDQAQASTLTTLTSISFGTDWGQIAGGRSPLMARLYAEAEEQARVDALGIETGLTQDELLAEFEASLSGDTAASNEIETSDAVIELDASIDAPADITSIESVIEGDLADLVSDTANPVDAFESSVSGGQILDQTRPQFASTGSIFDDLAGLDLARQSMLAYQALPDEAHATASLTAGQITDLDRFTQAMAGFGGQSAFAGLSVSEKEEGRLNDIIGTQARPSLLTQIA